MNYLIGIPGQRPRILIETDDPSQVITQLSPEEILNTVEFDVEGRPLFHLISSEKEVTTLKEGTHNATP